LRAYIFSIQKLKFMLFTKNRAMSCSGKRLASLLLMVVFMSATIQLSAAKKRGQQEAQDTLKSSTFSGLKWRGIGPAFTSGRIADFAVNPNNHSEYYVAVASGHVWKTVNNGTTFEPVFDNYGAYAMGAGYRRKQPPASLRIWQRCLSLGGWRQIMGEHGVKRIPPDR